MKRFVLLALLTLPLVTFGAFDGIVFSSVPQHPEPGERVTVTATLLGEESAGVVFVWFVDGKEVAEGVGMTELAIDAPALGKRTDIEVTASGVGGAVLGTGTYTIQPASVTIEWEGSGSAPPFYKGKPLLTGHGQFTATAVPAFVNARGERISPSDILYTWRINGKQDSAGSGYGRSVYRGETPFFDDAFTVSVTAETRDRSLAATDRVSIAPVAPQLLIYEYTPLGGPALGRMVGTTYPFIEEEVSFIAYPLFATNAESSIVSWFLNGSLLEFDTGDQRLAVFKKTGEGTGSFRVTTRYEDPVRFLDKTESSFFLEL